MRFVETPVFTASVRRHLDDEQYRALQLALLLRPEQGQLIPGGGGLLYVYAKNEQGDLTPAQAKALARLVREEFK
jgi:hypothetical protein